MPQTSVCTSFSGTSKDFFALSDEINKTKNHVAWAQTPKDNRGYVGVGRGAMTRAKTGRPEKEAFNGRSGGPRRQCCA